MVKKKVAALLTAAFLMFSAIPVSAKPLGIYLKSKTSEEVLYMSYSDYIKAHAIKNEAFAKVLEQYDVVGVAVDSGKNKKVVDYAQYAEDYKKGQAKNFDNYADKNDAHTYKNPDKVKELDKKGNIGKEIDAPHKEDNNQGQYISIAEARKAEKGKVVTTKGIVTRIIGNNAFIQDDNSGIYIYCGPTENINLKEGNSVLITGAVDEYNGLKQLKDGGTEESKLKIELINENQNIPSPEVVKITDLNESLQGKLVTIKEVKISGIGTADKAGSYSVKVTDGQNVIDIRIDGRLNPKIESSSFKIGSTIDVTAPVGKYNTANQLMLSKISDIKVTDEGNGEVPSAPVKKIREIQGKAHRSPLEGQLVETEAIVTAVSNDKYQKGFFMQDPNPDNDPATSEGIFVKYSNTSSVKPGDKVKVSGTVKELLNGLNKDGLLETTIEASNVAVESSNNAIPEAIGINLKGDLLKNIDNDNFSSFDIDEDAIDYFESLEGMLVKVVDPLIVGAAEKYGEIYVVPNKGLGSEHQITPNGGIKALANDFNPEALTIDDVLIPLTGELKVKVGDTFKDNEIPGIMSYGFGKYKILNTQKLPEILPTGKDREITTIEKGENKLTVASYNIENFNKLDSSKVEKVARSIVDNLKIPDIIGLIEVQDNDGETSGGNTDASQSYSALINKIKELSGVNYEFTDIAPEDGKDGGAPKGNIRNGFIYRTDRVSLINKTKGTATEAVSINETGLSVNPGRIDPTNSAFNSSRKPLVAEFEFGGEKVFIIANHLNSKGGDGSLFGNVQPPVRSSEVQRHKQAAIINSFIKDLQSKVPNANIVTLGDLNDFEFSETLNILKGQEIKNMHDKLEEKERYTYVYSGNSQVLDHVLVSNNLFEKANIDIVHINSQFTEAYGRISDHDPVLVQLELGLKELTPEQKLEAAKNNLTILGDLAKVTADLNLPLELSNGVKVTWESSDKDVVSNDGKVTRPEIGQEDKTVTLTATLTLNELTATKNFQVTVLAKQDVQAGVELPLKAASIGDLTEAWEQVEIVGTTYIQMLKNTSSLITPAMNFDGYKTKSLIFDVRTYGGSNAACNQVTISISLDNGDTWSEVKKVTAPSKTMTNETIDLSGYSGTNVKIKFETLGADGKIGAGIQNISITGTP